MRAASRVLAAGFALVAGYLVAGTPAVVLLAAGLAVLGLLAARAAVPAALPPLGAVAGEETHGTDDLQQFSSYWRINRAVSWSQVSARHYDSTARPLLTRLLAVALADGHGIDLSREPERARELLGEELWPLLDPGRPASGDTFVPGPDSATLHAVAIRLEELWP
ncbi:hypothetical protein [Actinomadura formosensis]|uniref:hypothetical protein n=1 Tax=Actinomadura formosensis TaxID=60706 RepID=UPI00082F56E5|nr:hypothetical protein [Actinomadura formosensis]